MSALPLYKSGPLSQPAKWPVESKNDPPRALRSLAHIVENDLCHRCGSCVGICPTKVLSLDNEEYPQVENLSACTDCDLCVKVCPGVEFNVESVAKQMFGFVPDYKDMHGHFIEGYLAFAADEKIRQASTSGGLVSALLLSLLKRNEIDGAVVIVSDKDELWKGRPIIARSSDEILAAAKSKYAIAPTNVVFEEIRNVNGRYALVGLPCQIHGFHKAARLDPRLRERIILTIGLFCHAAVEHEPMRIIWNKIDSQGKKPVRFISRVGKHPGTPHVEYSDGSRKPVYFPEATGFRPSSMEVINILYRLYTPPRCITCYDSTSEFADIAVGDPWMAPPSDEIDFKHGYSLTLARTKEAKRILKDCEKCGDIKLSLLKSEVARTANTAMGEEKRWRAFRILNTQERLGKATPDYGFAIPRPAGIQRILTEFNILSHLFCFLPIGRKFVLKLAFTNFGYSLLWLNNKKRVFRDWRKKTFARWKRKQTA